ncbi:MAG: RNA repair transcriptional activator RtcR [Gammaproteobacteria bacterium]|nr:RNA repair transcriptional activator RtcR [Gammaproteobacteria bacterium]
MTKPTIVLGFVGSTFDQGYKEDRWLRWRPTVSLCMHEDLHIDELHLLYNPRDKRLVKQVTEDIAQVSPLTKVIGIPFTLRDAWDFAEVYGALYDWVRAFRFDPTKNDYLLHITTGTHVVQICWYLLLEAHYLPARILQSSPTDTRAPQGKYHLIDLDLSRYDSLRSRLEAEQQANWQQLKADIATRNPAFNRLITEVEKVATRSTAPILIMGATGAGKSHLAKQIYQLKKDRFRMTGRFVDVNCATLRGDSAMSALFGHIKGAFTGAAANRAGLLKSADGGLLFLDEIGEIGLDEQAMLLKALEDKSFFPVGSDKEERADFQLIAGTNRDLRAEVLKGTFREDLFARLNTWTFDLPALKDRTEDIEPNLLFELERFSLSQQRQLRFHREALDQYLDFSRTKDALWRGNFRDLSASLVRMATLAEGSRITVENVQDEILRLKRLWSIDHQENDLLLAFLGHEGLAQIDEFDRIQLSGVIKFCQKSKSMADAGRQLFSASRAQKATSNDSDRLRKYLTRFGLSWESIQKV